MSLTPDQAADQARRYDEFHAWERARPALEAKKERDLAAARHQGRAAAVAAAMPAGTATPQSLELRAITGGDELGIRTDPGFRAAMARYSEARNAYWAALWKGERKEIDAATAAMMRGAADCYAAVFAVAVQEQRNKLQKLEDRLTRAERDRDQLKEERDRALDEARESRQLPAPIKVELTLPDTLPDMNINLKPSAGVDVEYDAHGRVTGTRPRGPSKVTKALTATEAGKSIVS